jgi:hypothetical protein
METYKIPNAMLKLGGIAAMAAALVMIAGFLIHPAGEDATHGTDPHWIPAHALLWLGFTLALIGWTGLSIAHASKAGKLGVVSVVVIILGTSFASWIFSSDVTFVPIIAAESPSLFKKIFTGSHIIIGIVSVLSWVLGEVLFGFSIIRAKVFPRAAGILLIVGSLIIPAAYLAKFSVHVVAVGALIAGVGQIWLGYELLRTFRKSTLQVGERFDGIG